MSRILSGGGLGWWWYPSMPCRSPGPHPGGSPGLHPKGESPGPHLGRGVSRPTPGGVSQQAPRQTPPNRRLLLRAVCILLECILVEHKSAAVTTPPPICSRPVYLPIKKAKLLKCQKKPSMRSSRMRTTRLLTVSRSIRRVSA